MALSEEELQTFGTGLSATKKGKLVNQLGIRDIEKELEYWKKQVDFYDKEFSKYPAFSAESNSVINQRDEAIKGVLSTSVFLLNKAQTYTNPAKGPVSPSSPVGKDLAVVKKYKGFDLNGALELSRTFSAGMTGRGGAQNPLTQQLLPSIKKGEIFVSATKINKPTVGATGPATPRVDASGRSGMGATTVKKPPVPVPVPVTGGGLKKGEVLFEGKKVKVGGSKWQQIIQDEFGSLWDVYNDNADVKKVIDLSVKEGWYNDETKLTARLQNTNWFRTTESAARQYNIQKSTDPATLEADISKGVEDVRALSLKTGSGVVLADGTLRMLSENKIKFGWSDQQLINAIGSEAVTTAQGGAQGIASLRQGTVAAGLRASADDYAQKVDNAMLDMWTADILKGTKTEAQFTEQMKLQASQQYRSLAPQIEKNQTVKQSVTMYSNAAQNVLGIDPSTIDWTQDKWNKALNYKDPKTNEYRTMDSSEWNRHLRSQPEWKKTDEAKNIYRNLALTLASGFGKTL
jgi:hypothetical protein